MRALLVILIVALGLGAMMRTRFAGLNLYVWFALFRPQEFAWDVIAGLRLSMVVFVAFVGSSLLTGVFPDVTHPLSVLTLLFLVPILLAQVNAIDPAQGWPWLQMLATTMLISLFIVRMTDTRKRFVWVLCIAAGSLGFFGAKYGVSYLLLGGAQFTTGTGGMFGDRNDFALGVARVVFLVIAAAQNGPWRSARWAFAVAIPLCVLGVVSTFSRGGFLGLVAGAVVFLLLQRRRVLALSGAAVLVLAGLQVVPVPAEYYGRLETINSKEMDASSQGRVHFWRVAIDMARDHPLGVGLKHYELNYDRYDFLDGAFGTNRAVHNTFLQVWAETGYLGFAIFALLVVVSIALALRVRHASRTPGLDPADARLLFTSANALLASTAAFLAGGFFASQLLNDLNWFTFALVASLDRVSRGLVAEARKKPHVESGRVVKARVEPVRALPVGVRPLET